jgi:hypothetical protein
MAEAEVEILLRLAGVNPNSEAIRIMISVCRLAIARYGDCTRNPEGDLIIEPYFWIASIASAQSAPQMRGKSTAVQVGGNSQRARKSIPFPPRDLAKLGRALRYMRSPRRGRELLLLQL